MEEIIQLNSQSEKKAILAEISLLGFEKKTLFNFQTLFVFWMVKSLSTLVDSQNNIQSV